MTSDRGHDGRRTTDDGRRTTDDGRRTTDDGLAPVLAVARNLVSALRLLDVVALFVDDPRVRIHWTIVPGSEFAAETGEYLARLGVRLTPWEQACKGTFALILATSGNGDLHRLTGPLVLLPHGAGYSRVLAPGHSAPAGLAPSQLVHDGRVIAQFIGLEHEDQRARLAAYCPEAAAHGYVLGDPTRDRMARGAPLRGTYRSALGVPDGCSLIVLSSTWGPGSLLDVQPELPARLAAALPYDEYRLAAVVHPNTAAKMGAWEVGRLLLRARSAGLRLIAPDRWEGAVLAADLVIGDHGSVSLYAAAAGRRVLFGAYDGAQIVTDSPMAELAAGAPHMHQSSDSVSSVDAGLNQDADGAVYRCAARSFGVVGRSLEVTAEVVYQILGMPPLRVPGVRAPEPVQRLDGARTAHLVLVGHSTSAQAELVVRRFAAGIDPDLLSGYESAEVCRHVAVTDTETDMTLRENAETLLLEPLAGSRGDMDAALFAALVREPWLRTVATTTGPSRCIAAIRGHLSIALHAEGAALDPAVLPSVLLSVLDLEHGDMAAAFERLHAGVPVRVGANTAVVHAQGAAEAHP